MYNRETSVHTLVSWIESRWGTAETPTARVNTSMESILINLGITSVLRWFGTKTIDEGNALVQISVSLQKSHRFIS